MSQTDVHEFGGYQRERIAIEAFLRERWIEFSEGWADQTRLVMDGQAFPLLDAQGNPIFDRIRVTIKSGAVLQGSVGRIRNQHLHIGTLTCSVYTEGGSGSHRWRWYVEKLHDLFHEVSIDKGGAPVAATSDVLVRFSPPQLAPNHHPYVGADFDDPPYHITNFIAPFVRYSYR